MLSVRFWNLWNSFPAVLYVPRSGLETDVNTCIGEVLLYRVFLIHTLRYQVTFAYSWGDPYIIRVTSAIRRSKRNKRAFRKFTSPSIHAIRTLDFILLLSKQIKHMYWRRRELSKRPFVTFTSSNSWGDPYDIRVTSAISKSYLVPKSMNKKNTIQ